MLLLPCVSFQCRGINCSIIRSPTNTWTWQTDFIVQSQTSWKQYALLGLISYFQPLTIPTPSAQKPHWADIWPDTLIPTEISIMLERLFCRAVKLGKAALRKTRHKVELPAVSFCPSLKGSLQWPPAKTCFNGGLWSANNLGGGKKLLGWLRGGGGLDSHQMCVLLFLSFPVFDFEGQRRLLDFAFQVGRKLNHQWPTSHSSNNHNFHCYQISTLCLFATLSELSLIVLLLSAFMWSRRCKFDKMGNCKNCICKEQLLIWSPRYCVKTILIIRMNIIIFCHLWSVVHRDWLNVVRFPNPLYQVSWRIWLGWMMPCYLIDIGSNQCRTWLHSIQWLHHQHIVEITCQHLSIWN